MIGMFLAAALTVATGAPRPSGDLETSAKEWRLLARDLAYRAQTCPLARDGRTPLAFVPPVAECAHPEAVLTAADRDPLDVALRRTRALAADLAVTNAALAELAAAAAKTAPADPEARFALFAKLVRVRRAIAFSNPLLKDIDKLLFVGREPYPPDEYDWGTHMCDQFFGFHATQKRQSRGDGLYVLEQPFSDAPKLRNLFAHRPRIKSASPYWNGRVLQLDGVPHENGSHTGAFLAPDVSWDGTEILFCWTPGKPELRQWNEETCWHIMKCRADGSNLEMITWGDRNDLFPCWLPNGRVTFCSERRRGYGRCHFRPCPNFTLFTMFPDGSDITCISPHETNEFEPSVDNDGMIVYTRWDYVDRGFNQSHNPWITYPDGRDPREFHGNTRAKQSVAPHFSESIRAIPGSRKYVATACGHHTLIRGSLVIIDPSVPDDDGMSQIKRLTPDQLLPESEWVDWSTRHAGAYATAWPLSEKYFLCVYDGAANGQYARTEPYDARTRRFALVLLDAFGNKVEIFDRPGISCFDPMPLRARKRPPVIPHKTLVGRPLNPDGTKPEPIANLPKVSEVGLINVYNSRHPFPAGAEVKELRIWQILPKSEPLVGHPRLGACDHTPGRRCLGTVPVEKDGSALFEMPVTVPFFMQALDANGCAIQTMRSATYTQPGERLTCNGCHEDRAKYAQAAAPKTPLAYRRAPSKIRPEVDGGKPWNYVNVVQPVLDRKCVACHAPGRPNYNAKKMPNLALGDVEKNPYHFATSFLELFERNLVQLYTKNYTGPGWYRKGVQRDDFTFPYSEPGKIGARASRLYAVIKDGHHGVTLTPEEMRRLVLFMDSHGAYLSHDYRATEQCFGAVVEPAFE